MPTRRMLRLSSRVLIDGTMVPAEVQDGGQELAREELAKRRRRFAQV